MSKSSKNSFLVPILSVLIGLVAGALIMLAFGFNPLTSYVALFKGAFGNPFVIGQTIKSATPLIFTGLGFAVAYTAGFFNIGLAGQALWGWLISVWIALAMPDVSGWIVVPLAIIGGAVAGALWAAIAGFLKAYFNTSEVITTIMLNHTSIYVVDYIIRYILTERADATAYVGPNARLRWQLMTDMTNGSQIHFGIFLALLAAVFLYILMEKTSLGFELKSVGMNAHAANYAGMSAKKNIILAMALSGAFAGLGGAMNGLGEFGNIFVTNGIAPAIGFDGMAVALLGALNPIGTILAALLFGGLQTGSPSMQFQGIPPEIVDIITALIIFFVGANYIITYFQERRSQPILDHNVDPVESPGGDK